MDRYILVFTKKYFPTVSNDKLVANLQNEKKNEVENEASSRIHDKNLKTCNALQVRGSERSAKNNPQCRNTREIWLRL
jgi:hypothetical protein